MVPDKPSGESQGTDGLTEADIKAMKVRLFWDGTRLVGQIEAEVFKYAPYFNHVLSSLWGKTFP